MTNPTNTKSAKNLTTSDTVKYAKNGNWNTSEVVTVSNKGLQVQVTLADGYTFRARGGDDVKVV